MATSVGRSSTPRARPARSGRWARPGRPLSRLTSADSWPATKPPSRCWTSTVERRRRDLLRAPRRGRSGGRRRARSGGRRSARRQQLEPVEHQVRCVGRSRTPSLWLRYSPSIALPTTTGPPADRPDLAGGREAGAAAAGQPGGLDQVDQLVGVEPRQRAVVVVGEQPLASVGGATRSCRRSWCDLPRGAGPAAFAVRRGEPPADGGDDGDRADGGDAEHPERGRGRCRCRSSARARPATGRTSPSGRRGRRAVRPARAAG